MNWKGSKGSPLPTRAVKISVLALLVSIAFSLTACSSSPSDQFDRPAPNSATVSAPSKTAVSTSAAIYNPTSNTQVNPPLSQTVALTGRIEDNKFDCVLDGDTISVTNQNGTVIGVAKMGPLTGPSSDCYQEYTISSVTTNVTLYQFEWDGVVVATYSLQQLGALGWHVPTLYQT